MQGPGLPADPAAYEGRLPVECELRDQPVGSIEDPFVTAIDAKVIDGRQMREPYAHWLAEQTELTVIGPGQR